MVSYTYCIKNNYLVKCDGGELYYLFEYTKNNELLISRCINDHCTQVEDIVTELGKYKFADEIWNFGEIKKKVDDITHFLSKYNLKVYFIGDNIVLEALYTPQLFYYKYFALKEAKEKIDLVNAWFDSLLLAIKVIEEIGIREFKSHMDTLDGRYTIWLNSEEPSASFISREGDLVNFWVLYNDCNVLIERKGRQICINSLGRLRG
ncbi:hypothetical protein V6M85_09415 [Sulfolobus tengchongensis]|uniref:Uncharacterized protein n=1 Tax=Sulfolobus tengchongensis TaxID=207809 RepID=A0AAX4KZV2_9CREN